MALTNLSRGREDYEVEKLALGISLLRSYDGKISLLAWRQSMGITMDESCFVESA